MNFIRPNTKFRKERTRRRKKELTPTQNNTTKLTKAEQLLVAQEQGRMVKWLKDIKAHESFGKSWSLFVLHEIVLQCMGKLPITLNGLPYRTFNVKEATKAVKLGAEISGALIQGNNKFLNVFPPMIGEGEKEGPQLPRSDAERVEEVYDILSGAGVFVEAEQETQEIEIEAEVV